MRDRQRAVLAASAVGVLVGALGLAFVLRLIVKEWEQISQTIGDGDRTVLVGALLVGLTGMTWIGLQWGRALGLCGAPAGIRARRFLPWYFVGQLGKYVPGGLWPVLGRSELAVRGGVARTAAYPSVALSLLTTYLGSLALVALAAPFAMAGGSASSRLWVLLVLPLGLTVLHPAVLERLVRLAERVLVRTDGRIVVPEWKATIGLIARHIPAWVAISVATWLVADALFENPPIAAIVLATPLSWFVGFVAVPVPGGVGVREATFVGVLTGSMASADAATVAVTSRLVFIGVDLAGAALSLLLGRAADRGRESSKASARETIRPEE